MRIGAAKSGVALFASFLFAAWVGCGPTNGGGGGGGGGGGESGPEWESTCNGEDSDGDGVVDDGCVTAVAGTLGSEEEKSIGAGFGSPGGVNGGSCLNGQEFEQAEGSLRGTRGVHFRFLTESHANSADTPDWRPGRLDHLEWRCGQFHLDYNDAGTELQFASGPERRSWETSDPKPSLGRDGEGKVSKNYQCGPDELVSGLAGTVRDGDIVAARVLCTRYEVEGREDGTWQLSAEVDSSSSDCLSHESQDGGSCDETLRCPEGEFMSSPSEIGDPPIEGIVASCVEVDGMEVSGEDGETVEQPVEVNVASGN